MKTLLAILGSMSVGISPAIATISTTPAYNKNSGTQAESELWKEPTSMQAIQEGINNHYQSINSIQQWTESIQSRVQKNYDLYVANTSSQLTVLKMEPISESVDNTFQDVYNNNTPNKQTFQTQSYSKEITNTATFNIQLQDKVAVSVSASFFFANISVGVDFSSTRAWTDTQTAKETITAPSQSFTVDPYSRGIASYVIKSGTYNVTGAVRVNLPLDTLMWTSLIAPDFPGDEEHNYSYTLREVVGFLNEAGYGDMIRMDSDKFTTISTDNPENPTMVSLNLPVNYVSRGGKLEVNFTQEPLN